MGHTVAGWTGTALVVAGAAVAGVAFAAGSTAGLGCGLALTALGALAAWLLHLAAWGKPTGPRRSADRPWRTRDAAARHGHPDCLGCRLAGRAPAVRAPVAARVRERADA
ncbi:HGxxPAAW family protein [Kitasatospora mediocidica]|uniref:HGxxPAAW family protein n=1 Tax=Kitasatospora mediocidica TaxID=58352 RepID=UPI0012F943EA|nr:HGxxPAAW family protein [Kitasatospora mediocidica]